MPPKRASSRSVPAKKTSVPTSRKPRTRSVKPKKGFVSRVSDWLDSISPTSILGIGLCVVTLSIVHSLFLDVGDWYFSILRPDFGFEFNARWLFEYLLTGIFALATFSIVTLWNIRSPGRAFLMWLFVLMGMLHLMWSMFFFGLHVLQVAFVDMMALWILTWIIILLAFRRSKTAALMLVPYLLWVTFVGVFNGFVAFS